MNAHDSIPSQNKYVVATFSEPVEQALRAITASVFHPQRKHGDGHGRSMPSRRTDGALLEAARVDGVGKLLHVGMGSGYLAAVASHLSRWVFAVEKSAPMADWLTNILPRWA